MFGYVQIFQPELKIREYECYRGAYCGLCRQMGKCTGQCSRMTLRYDAAAMVLLRMAARGTQPVFEQKRCFLHPLTKAPVLAPCEETEAVSCMMAALAYHKCKDDMADEKGAARLGAYLLYPYFSYLRRRAARCMPEIDRIAERGMQNFAQAEKQSGGSADIPANAFGELMGNLLSYNTEGETHAILHELGSAMGRWVFLLDAAEDYEDDVKKGRFNALHALYGDRELDEQHKKTLDMLLGAEIADAVAAADLIDWDGRDDLRAVVYNILCMGMPAQAGKVLFPQKECKKRKGERGA
ncbi:MAG: hypothetical protein E7581_08365 [Ruminococcaceae bacterium]|nr:hypothetical protein [Oscillospiraceae bacterium]